jgi:predicted GH43/DUF377 family glycosyl hydrolase
VLARNCSNILEPREPYEFAGQVPNVASPSGIIVDEYGDEGSASLNILVRVYCGAADSVIALATTTVRNLIRGCDA